MFILLLILLWLVGPVWGEEGYRYRLSTQNQRRYDAPARLLSERARQQIWRAFQPLVEQSGDRVPVVGTLSRGRPQARVVPKRPRPQGPLRVVRFSPQSQDTQLDRLSITFSEPMVPLGKVGDGEFPVHLEPLPAGKWRWQDTCTLCFEPKGGFPNSTRFEVEVPAETRALSGTLLGQSVSWNFSTPTVHAVWETPYSRSQSWMPLMVVEFDQPVEILEAYRIFHLDSKLGEVVCRLARPDEVPKAFRQRKQALCLLPTVPLAKGTEYQMRFEAGLNSTEGPLPTTKEQTHCFSTPGPLVLYGDQQEELFYDYCTLLFTNDLANFTPEMLKIDPPIPFAAEAHGCSIQVKAAFRPGHTYSLTVDPNLSDKLGQTLGTAPTVHMRRSPLPPSIQALSPHQGNLVSLKPGSPLTLSCRNLDRIRVSRYPVRIQDWPAYRQGTLPLPDPSAQWVQPAGEPLAVSSKPGHWVMELEAGDLKQQFWVQVTNLELRAFQCDQDLLVGCNQPGALLSAGASQARVGSDGWASLKLDGGSQLLLVESGEDQALLADPWEGVAPRDELAWYLSDAQRLYRPAEKVRFKGWLRFLQAGRQLSTPHSGRLRYKCTAPRGEVVASGELQLSSEGGFSGEFSLPSKLDLGIYDLEVKPEAGLFLGKPLGEAGSLNFEVADYRRPEFTVHSQVLQSEGFLGEASQVAAEAQYFGGGGLVGARVDWSVQPEFSSYTPPGWSGYSFSDDHHDGEFPRLTAQGRTDGRGRSLLTIEHLEMKRPQPLQLRVLSDLSDLNGRNWKKETRLLLHPSRYYVGLRRIISRDPAEIAVETVVTDWRGRKVEAPLQVELWDSEKALETRKLSSAQALRFRAQGNSLSLRAQVCDPQGRLNCSRLPVNWGYQRDWSHSDPNDFKILPDRDLYQPGDTARLLVQAPFKQGRGVLRLPGSQQAFEVQNGQAQMSVQLGDQCLPVRVDLLQGSMALSSRVDLKVSTASRRLSLELKAAPVQRPGAPSHLTLQLRDAARRPVAGAEVMVQVLDEALSALSDEEKWPDPLSIFYGPPSQAPFQREQGLQIVPPGVLPRVSFSFHNTDLVKVVKVLAQAMGRNVYIGPGVEGSVTIDLNQVPADTALQRVLQAAGCDAVFKLVGYNTLIVAAPEKVNQIDDEILGKSFSGRPHVLDRGDFSPVAAFFPNVRTDARGRADLKFRLPDSLTRYKITAVAARDLSFGKGEGSFRVHQALSLRPSLPRFLTLGDRCRVPVIVQNMTARPISVQVVGRASNAEIQGGSSLRVPAWDRREVAFQCRTQQLGKARFQFVALSSAHSDSVKLDLPVVAPAARETLAHYGKLDGDATFTQPVNPPEDALLFGGLDVSLSPSALSELHDAAFYLQGYPYECGEQLASRLLSQNSLKSLGIPYHDRSAQDWKLLEERQRGDGGFAYWPGRGSDPFVTLHVIHAMLRTHYQGPMLEPALDYLQQFPAPEFPWRRHLQAYALNLRHLRGQNVTSEARELAAQTDLSLEEMGWLLPCLTPLEQPTLLLKLSELVDETAASASIGREESYWTLGSRVRSQAIVLQALLEVDPENELAVKLVRGLLAERRDGRWHNTQENCFALLALQQYFETQERVEPYFRTRVSLGSRRLADHTFQGHRAKRAEVHVELEQLGPALHIDKQGPGRMYYRTALTYAPRDTSRARGAGFELEREYQGGQVDEKGTWHIPLGTEVVVKVRATASGRRNHVALVDHLPAGLEPISKMQTWEWDHINLRDQQTEAFRGVFPGEGILSYKARACTKGEFIAAPATVEEMYAPETFGRSRVDRVVVE